MNGADHGPAAATTIEATREIFLLGKLNAFNDYELWLHPPS